MTTTTRSVDVPHVRLDPHTPSAYLRRMVIRACNRRGADGAEAGVIAEMERLLSHHVQSLFEAARDYAVLASRSEPNAEDMIMAHAESSHGSRQLKRESRKRRRALPLHTVPDSGADDEPLRETLLSLAQEIQDPSVPGLDDGPDGQEWRGGAGRKLENAFDWAPRLPPTWTYPSRPHEATDPPPAKVTSAALDFVKATVAEADVNPDLGIVHYRKRAKR